jgi:hypothetical protein
MAYTTAFNLSKPAYRTVRYDEELNLDMDIIEAALLGFPGTSSPGTPGNFPDVTPTTGMRWVDTGNDQERVYYNSSWQVVKQFT